MRDLDKFDVLMFDLNGTFMFGQDRFGPDQDYYASYRQLGGSVLSAETLGTAIGQVLTVMGDLYEDPEHHDRFPKLSEVFETLPATASLSAQERGVLEDVIAVHEIGVISQPDKESIQTIAERKRIVLVSNIWSKKKRWITYFKHLDLYQLFETIIFSSDHGCIKPSARIYRIALDEVGVAPERVLFVGDDPICDIEMPRSLGMATARVRGTDKPVPKEADFVLAHVGELLTR